MQIELTNYCNIKCQVCPTGLGKLTRKPLAMDPALFERLLNQVGNYLLTTSLWGWGESLLHPQLSVILRIIQNRDVTTIVSTNGQNLNDDRVLEALIRYPPTYLIVAMDGLTDETNSIFRVGAKIAPILDGVHRLSAMKRKNHSRLPILHFRYIVMKHNEHELPQLPKFAKDNQFDLLTVRTLSIIDAPEDTHQSLIPKNPDLRAYAYLNDKRINRNDFVCELAFIFPTIFADGTVVACDQDYNALYPLGKFTDVTSFADIWWSDNAARIRKTIRDNPERFSFCANCPFKDRPVGDCSIQRFDLRNR
jgi:radical SAM protein with 4Fe4S-binding SPASM domain